jgi:hypothetical protein
MLRSFVMVRSDRFALSRFVRVAALIVLCALLATTAACSSSSSKADSPASVAASYSAYTKAVSAKSGQAAADLLTQSSLQYYDRMRTLALDANAATLARQRLIDQLGVLTMRAALDPAVLRKASPHDIIQTGVEKGLISSGQLATSGLQQIRVNGDTATAVLKSSTGSSPIRFHREDGRWKFEVTSLLDPVESALSAAAAQQKVSANKLIYNVMLGQFGKAKAAQLYKPLGR